MKDHFPQRRIAPATAMRNEEPFVSHESLRAVVCGSSPPHHEQLVADPHGLKQTDVFCPFRKMDGQLLMEHPRQAGLQLEP